MGCSEQPEVHHLRLMRRPLVIYSDVGYADFARANIG
jgi:hypothetical protein